MGCGSIFSLAAIKRCLQIGNKLRGDIRIVSTQSLKQLAQRRRSGAWEHGSIDIQVDDAKDNPKTS